MKTVIDEVETLILLALDANGTQSSVTTGFRDRVNNTVLEIRDQGELLQFDNMFPSSAYTWDMTDSDRVYTAHKDYLVDHPAEILGDQSEFIFLKGQVMTWRGCRRIKRIPRGISCLGKASHWYEFHHRFVSLNGQCEYKKRIVPFDKFGNPLVARIQGHNICSPSQEGEMIILCASVIEDAHRANTMLAQVKEETEIKFPVPLGDYKEVFANRDGPMSGSRRKSIVHWVASHLRKSTKGNEHEVKRHTRGVQEFVIDGIRVRLSPNDRA